MLKPSRAIRDTRLLSSEHIVRIRVEKLLSEVLQRWHRILLQSFGTLLFSSVPFLASRRILALLLALPETVSHPLVLDQVFSNQCFLVLLLTPPETLNHLLVIDQVHMLRCLLSLLLLLWSNLPTAKHIIGLRSSGWGHNLLAQMISCRARTRARLSQSRLASGQDLRELHGLRLPSGGSVTIRRARGFQRRHQMRQS